MVVAAIVGIIVLHWISSKLSDWLSWPLIIAGALAFILGMATNSETAKKGGVVAVLVGLGLIVLDWASGFMVTLLKATGIIVLIVGLGITFMVMRKRTN
jgi:hypothetical protein